MVCSAAGHLLVLALVGWTSGGSYEALLPVSTLQTSRSYAVQYIVLTKPAPAAVEQVAYPPAPAESKAPAWGKPSAERAPAAWPRPTLAVSVAFVVDTNGVVDRSSLRVIESPGHPQTDRRYHAHVYVVAATMQPDASPMDPAGYDSLVSLEMTRHAADLTFLPALEGGQPVRSSVLISCQMLQPG